ncbi:MAG: GIY-YIG nuclease family protein [Candidatus Electryonea clarkiae]|nr:GIY-YIG nuclease family protein [Candidatus Electryonea clarkiae]MDP8286765.1 GIY-YIG nuclease family protein [Candidatus Electryonea clarkiae]
MDKDYILSEIKRTAEENGGKPLGRERFEKFTGIKPSDWAGKYWIRWNELIIEAGYKPNQMQSAYKDDFLIQKLIELIEERGHFPTALERKLKARQDKNFPSHNTFSRFGRKEELIRVVLKYCEDNDVENLIVDACKNAITKTSLHLSEDKNEQETEFGFVYLIKSGKHYKIGRSVSPEKREYELKIQLPEKPSLVHKIKTDDPVGIEKYWHDRFKEKRKGGEWFELSQNELQAFRRRKFM